MTGVPDTSIQKTRGDTSVEYDAVPYPSGPFRYTHPCHLATLPILFGIAPPPPSTARVLELGCAAGGNLIPMAQDLPEGQFLGIDLSLRQIADGHSQLSRLPLNNIQLRHLSITDVDDTFGKFDYILCHGVYSWVPRVVQDKILEIGREHLDDHGVLYVSYNTLPGWHFRGVVRDMMKYHVAPFSDPLEKIGQARSLLEFLIESAESSSEAFRQVLKDEADILARQTDSYLFHEHLEDVNEPLYFSEFVRRAEAAGLSYLAETEFPTMLADNFGESTATILQEAPLLRQEQYMDFLRARMFRGTLLCHGELEPDRKVLVDRLSQLALSAGEKVDFSPHDLSSTEPLEFQMLGREISASAPITKQALAILGDAYPAAVPMVELSEAAWSKIGGATGQYYHLYEDLMAMFSRGVLRAVVDPPSFLATPVDPPRTTPLARDQAIHNLAITNRLHETVVLDPVPLWTLRYLDGKHSAGELVRLLIDAVKRGDFEVSDDQGPIKDLHSSIAGEIIDHALSRLAENALLVS